jgi:hypothetical protein
MSNGLKLINTKRIKMFYLAGVIIAVFMPKNLFYSTMNQIFILIDKRTVFINRDFFFFSII